MTETTIRTLWIVFLTPIGIAVFLLWLFLCALLLGGFIRTLEAIVVAYQRRENFPIKRVMAKAPRFFVSAAAHMAEEDERELRGASSRAGGRANAGIGETPSLRLLANQAKAALAVGEAKAEELRKRATRRWRLFR